MKLVNGMIEMEQTGFPGSVGDSAAETCRLSILQDVAMIENPFKTPRGYLRHPRLAEIWGGEADFSSDQALPMIMACSIHQSWFKIPGTSTIVSPGVYFAIRGMWRAFAWTVRAQNLIFSLPYRWSDSKKWFERSEGSSADYLNYFVSILFLRRMGIIVQPRPETLDKIKSYYASEPNSEWLTESYAHVFEQIKGPAL